MFLQWDTGFALTCIWSYAFTFIHSHIVWIVVDIDRVDLKCSNHLFNGIIDEDEANQSGEAFFSEASDVLDYEAGICNHQNKALGC